MRIIKQGDPSRINNPRHFKCTQCGCEFIADNTEYVCKSYGFNEEFYEHECPCCNKMVYVER